MSQLLRIIMINGHMPGVVELALDGHSNICGTNASGKTTLQRMVPVFYGEQPNRVVPRTRDRFDVYYLPYQDSYIVYEYSRANGDLAQVVLTKRRDGLDYRFVDGGYQPEQYLLQQGNGVKARSYAEWGQELRKLGIDSSHKITATSEYRSIIQNDMGAVRGNRKDSIRLRQLASRYSLVQSPHRLRHIEKLVSAVHAKEGKMDTLKSMLATILEEDGHQRPENTFKPARIRAWIQQMRQYMRQDDLQDQFGTLKQTASDVQDNLTSLWQLKPLLENSLAAERKLRADTEQQFQRSNEKLQNIEQAFQVRSRELNVEISEAETTLTSLKTRLDDLQSRYDAYQDRDMDALQRDMDKLTLWREELQELNEHYQLMTEKHEDAKHKLDEQKIKLAESLQKLQKKSQQEIAAKRTRQDEIRSAQDVRVASLREEFEHRVEQQQRDYQNKIDKISARLAQLQAELKLSPLTTDEQDEIAQADSRVEEAQLGLTDAIAGLERGRRELEQAQRQRSEQNEELTRTRQQLHRLSQVSAELERHLVPEPGTLRHFLQENFEDWEARLGKVIAEPLLTRTDLNPQLSNAESATLLGVSLDLSAIELPQYARRREDTLARLQQTREERVQTEQLKAQHEKELGRLSQEVSEKEHKVHSLQQRRRQSEQDVEFSRDAKHRLQVSQRELVQQRQADACKELEQSGQQRDTLLQARKEMLAQLKHDHKEQELEYRAGFEDDLQRIHDEIQAQENDVERKHEDNHEKIKALESAFNEALAADGVDSNRLRTVKDQIQQLRDRINKTEARQDELKEYKDFMRTDWQHNRPRWMEQEQQAKQQQFDKSTEFSSVKEQFAGDVKELNEEIRSLKKRLQESETIIKELEPVNRRLADMPLGETSSATELSAHSVCEQLNRSHQALEQRGRLQRTIKEQVDAFESALRRDASADFLQLMDKEYGQLGEQPDDLKRMEMLADVLQILQNQQVQIVDQGKNIGGALEKFFTVFDDINRRVGQYSRRLTEVVGDELDLEGIRRSEVKISSTIDELGFWQPLKNLTRLFAQWNESGDLLPPEAYLNTLADVADLLRADQEYSLESLLKLELHLNERGSELVIRNDRQLLESSSHGMAYLILCKFLLAFTRLLRGESDVVVHWPIDEIGTLAYHNVEKLFAACDANNIHIVGAFPNPESDVLLLFKHRYLIEPHDKHSGKGQLKRIQPKVSRLSEKLKTRTPGEEMSA